MPPKKRSKRRGSQETERMSTRARSPEVDELSCVPEPGDIGLETQQKSDTSDEDTQDTQATAATTQKGKGTGKGKAEERSKKPPVLFSA